ncbi:BEN domain-containing protein 7 isoform X2 [Triplophysa dalaica]|uniref:BEN domain-containing protein 7 isoform X2 n=1 Tax=Triplophysa dalaica TaxID=1582913 RepID=UPI0024DFC14A|nr:BEN domain-containing protein 7 isoform X2 [Triplophysa dalaica]
MYSLKVNMVSGERFVDTQPTGGLQSGQRICNARVTHSAAFMNHLFHELDDVDQNDTEGDALDPSESEVWLGDEGMEIKKQITGMMRLLSDKTGRVYQRVGRERETLKQEPQEDAFSMPVTQSPTHENPQYWSSVLPLTHGQYSTRSRTQRMLNHSKTNDMALPPAPAAMATESSCCMCNCKSTLRAILLELRTMRKLIQTQRGAQDKQSCQVSVPLSRNSISRSRTRKRRPGHIVSVLTPSSKKTPPLSPPTGTDGVIESDLKEKLSREDTLSTLVTSIPDPFPSLQTLPSRYHVTRGQRPEPEVQLAEDHDVFISKAQLDSILLNYTRSGSLLFRKLVCAFFDDATLANSLPNGKRKRGLNDTRKGLDQNIVGAIKVFTEKYCTANGIEKLPGPRDWVQILQDQIKLARRRLKRETASDVSEILQRTCADTTEKCPQTLDKVGTVIQNGAVYERTECLVAMDSE